MLRRAGYHAAERILTRLDVESKGRSSQIQVLTRIGIHYGPIQLYKNAAGVLRPTGTVCFVADAIASDRSPREVNGSSVVFSEAFRDLVGEGNTDFFTEAFEELPPLQKGPAKGLRRFIRRRLLDREPKVALYKTVVKRPESWEPTG